MFCRTTTEPTEDGTIFIIPEETSLTIGIARKDNATKPTTEIRLSKADIDEVVAILCSFMIGMDIQQMNQLRDQIVEEVRKSTQVHKPKPN